MSNLVYHSSELEALSALIREAIKFGAEESKIFVDTESQLDELTEQFITQIAYDSYSVD